MSNIIYYPRLSDKDYEKLSQMPEWREKYINTTKYKYLIVCASWQIDELEDNITSVVSDVYYLAPLEEVDVGPDVVWEIRFTNSEDATHFKLKFPNGFNDNSDDRNAL